MRMRLGMGMIGTLMMNPKVRNIFTSDGLGVLCLIVTPGS